MIIIIIKKIPYISILQNIIKYLGTLFLLYLAYKISFSKSSKEEEKKNPVTFFDTYFFQFLNPKGVLFGIIIVSTYLELGENYLSYAIQIVLLAFIFSSTSITLWTFIGKFLRKFATNDKFINYFNYAMSLLLLLSIVTIYI